MKQFPLKNQFKNRQNQQGIALIAALFLVVIIGAAVVLMAVLSIRNSQQTTQNLLQTRAVMAANAAIEYGAHSLVNGSDCVTIAGTVNVPAFSDFSVTLTCADNSYNRTSQAITIFELSVVAEFGSEADADYVWTQTDATIEL